MEGFLTRAKFWPLMPPDFSLRISCVHLWERFIFLQNLCLLLFSSPRINKHSERWQKYLLLPSKPIYPHLQSSEVPIFYWESWKSITSNNIYTFLAKGPFWPCTSLNARKKKKNKNKPGSSWKKIWILFKNVKLWKDSDIVQPWTEAVFQTVSMDLNHWT